MAGDGLPELNAKALTERNEVPLLDLEFLSALEKTLSECSSENDDRAYRDL